MTEPLRFAIRGSGMIAQIHARALAELGGVAGLRVMVGRTRPPRRRWPPGTGRSRPATWARCWRTGRSTS